MREREMKVLVVGGSGGIGSALVKMLQNEGHTVHNVSRSGESEAEFNDSCDVVTDELPKVEGAIDSLVYLPGTINLKPFSNLKEEDFLNDYHVNVLGAVKAVQAYLPNLKKSESPSVVLVSTVAVQEGMPFHASVASAKGAVEGLGRSLAAELAPKIRVNVVAPSLTNTPLAESLLDTEKKAEASAKRHPLQRVGESDDIANAIHFLISPKSSWMTGQVVHVDGGLSSLKLF